jgi:glycosyltransferase involved in cell wall biosynthesis
MRLAFDAVPLLDTRTGVGRFVDETITRLAARDDLDIVAFGWPLGGRDRLREASPPGIGLARLPFVGPPLRAAWRRLDVPPIEMWTGSVDVVHGANFVVPPAWKATELVTIHDLTMLRYPELCTADTLEFPSLIRRAIRRGAWVHTVSESVRGEVIDAFAADPDRVVCIHNGVTAAAEIRGGDGRRLVRTDRYVLALGTVEPRKDLPTLVEAFDLVADDDPDLWLVLAGPDGWGADDLTARIHRAVHRNRILRLGFVDDDDRAALLKDAAAFAYPSVYEGFGLPPLEAMQAGTPVVTTSAGGLAEVVADAALVVEPRDVDALAGALGKVLADDALADDLRARGRRNVERFSWDATTDALVSLYRTMITAR